MTFRADLPRDAVFFGGPPMLSPADEDQRIRFQNLEKRLEAIATEIEMNGGIEGIQISVRNKLAKHVLQKVH